MLAGMTPKRNPETELAKEIERKFLVDWDKLKAIGILSMPSYHITQGYLATSPRTTVRIRIIDADLGLLTVKGESVGGVCDEYEYPIPLGDAVRMLRNQCRIFVQKRRYRVTHNDLTWEVDVFTGVKNANRILAEVELKSADQHVDIPEWVTQEVTGDARYFNSCMTEESFVPYPEWEHIT